MYTEKDALKVALEFDVAFNKFSIEDLIRGLNFEKEYVKDLGFGDELMILGRIVLGHLNKHSNYYNKFYGIEMFEAFLKTKE